MASDVVIQDAEGIVHVTLNGLVFAGNPIAHNGTNWVHADASYATTQLYAQYIAGAQGVSGQIIPAYRRCTIYDVDAPYTANTIAYLSGTAGAITHTRPATNGDVIQVLGRALDTTHLRVDIQAPRSAEDFLEGYVFNAQSAGLVEPPAADGTTTAWVGIDVDAAAVAGVFTARFPENVIALEAATVIINTQAATALDLDVTVVACYDNDTNTGDAGTSTTGRTTTVTTADNQVQKCDISSCFDSDFIRAGRTFGVRLDPDAGDFLLLGLYLRYTVV